MDNKYLKYKIKYLNLKNEYNDINLNILPKENISSQEGR